MKQIELYITDNAYIAKGIRNKFDLSLNVSEGVWEKVKERTYTALMEINPKSLYSTRRTDQPYIAYLERYRESQVRYYNAFEPTQAGCNRFAVLCRQTRLEPENFFRLVTETSDFRPGSCGTELSDVHVDEETLLRWAEQSMDEAYTECFRKNGYELHYSCRLFPIFTEIKKKMDEDAECMNKSERRLRVTFRLENADVLTYLSDSEARSIFDNSANIKKLTGDLKGYKGKVVRAETRQMMINPPMPYSYLDFLQEVVTNGDGISLTDATEILYNLYLCGLITFPRTPSRTISPDMVHKIMTPESLQGLTGYEEAITEVRYNDIPDHLLKNSPNAGAILLLDYRNGDFLRLYEEVGNKKEKAILDMLIRRQLCIYAEPCTEERCRVTIKAGKNYFSGEYTNIIEPGWEKIIIGEQKDSTPFWLKEGQDLEIVEIEEVKEAETILHDIFSIIRLLKLHSVGNIEDITETVEALYRSVYISRAEGRYLTLRETEMLKIVPPQLRSMESYCNVIESIRNRKSTNKVKKEISGMIQENMKQIDLFCKKGIDFHEEKE